MTAMSPIANGEASASPSAESPDGHSTTTKRKNEERPPQTRTKRNRDFKSMSAHIASLQEQVDALYAGLTSLRQHVDTAISPVGGSSFAGPSNPYPMAVSQNPVMPTSPALSRRQPNRLPTFQGPTSSAFNLGVAKSSLQTMGITSPGEGVEEALATQDATPAASPPLSSALHLDPGLHADKDPLWSLTREEATRLCHVWEDEMGQMYPILDINEIIRHAQRLYTFMEAARRTGLVQAAMPGADAIGDEQTSLLRLILAIALTVEGSGKSELGRRLCETDTRTQLLAPVDLDGIRMLVLTAMYHFHRDDESIAWRVLGFAARLSMELGLHRRETYSTMFTDDEERQNAIRLFWSIYVLDRRWSFGTGLPFALQDADIDLLLPKPNEATPYLTSMVAYSQIGSKVWKSIAKGSSSRDPQISESEIGFLDYQVVQWHRNIPDSLKYTGRQSLEPTNKALRRLSILLYLRANQMRILIYRPVLHTAARIVENLGFAQTVVDVAKDTIRVLMYTNQTSDIYRTQQVCFHYFLISALAVLFLAVSHAPAQFSDVCRDEFYTALELVRGLSTDSYVSKRLWRSLRQLKAVAPKIGLEMGNSTGNRPGNLDPHDAHSSAAVAMAGLAGHQVDETAIFDMQNQSGGYHQQGNSPNGMADDLTTLFEAAGGVSVSNPLYLQQQNGYAGDWSTATGAGAGAGIDIWQGWLGGEDGLSGLMGSLF
ncbi:hypothetical protein H2201_008448 [Coniosporium apollinis]|uniref:Xylanolytic transcriptional activator regulatory domain-containing protein n=1 Tax=Coniosporium apollinis TaxID=61459 RepID=A0ABQ9NGY1_9PEZI|nr:hypothetical protein H2201_008448 [Coniosporium apollinis]